METLKLVASLKNVSINQNDATILNDINFSIAEAELCYLVGRTGSGKSTLLKMLYGELEPESGFVEIADTKLNQLDESNIHLYRRKLGMVFQDFQLFPEWSIYENLAFVLKATEWKDDSAIKNRIETVLAAVKLDYDSSKICATLSGGEQQRLAIARAILNQPALLIADEPTGNLDPESSSEIIELIRDLTMAFNMASIVATHDYSLIERYPARLLTCENGTIR